MDVANLASPSAQHQPGGYVMAQPITFDDLIPQKSKPQLPPRAPAAPSDPFAKYGVPAPTKDPFAKFALPPLPARAPNAPIEVFQGGKTVYLDPATGLPLGPRPSAAAAFDAQKAQQYGRRQWDAAKADAQRNADKMPGFARALINGPLLNGEAEVSAYPVGAVVSARNALARATGIGKPGAYSGDAYRDAILAAEHQAQDAWAAKHPIANTALNVAGSLPAAEVLGLGRFVNGEGLAGAIGGRGVAGASLRSGLSGAGVGAISGANENYTDRGEGATLGALTGGLFGAALPVSVAVASKGAKVVPRTMAGLKQAGGELAGAVGLPQPGDIATTSQSDAQALKFLQKVAASRNVTPESVLADPRVAAGLPVKGVNLLGKRGVSLATGLAKGSDASQDVLDPVAREQIRSTAPGVVSDFHDLSGIDPNAAYGDVVKMASEGRTKASPLYDKAYAVGGVDSPTLQSLMPRLQATGAVNKALNIAAIEGRNPAELGLRWDTQQFPGSTTTVMDQVRDPASGTMRMVPREVQLPPVSADVPVQVQNPTMQTWDYIKRGLDDALEAYRDPTTRRLNLDTRGRAILGLHNDLRGELTNPDTAWGPDYQAALDAGGDPIRLEQAFGEGGRLMRNNVKPRDFQVRWNSYSPAEQQAFMGGFADDLNNQLGAGRLRPKDLTTDFTRQKLGTMMGDDAADDFLNRVQMRADLAKEAARYTPGTNSPTAEAQAANEEMSGAPAVLSDFAEKPGLESLMKTGVNLALAPVRGFARGFMAPLSPAGRVSFANILSQDPEAFAQSLQAPKVPSSIPALLPSAVAPSAGLLGGASAYGPA